MKPILFFTLFAFFITFSHHPYTNPSEIDTVKINRLTKIDQQALDKYGYMVVKQSGNDLNFASLALAVIKAESDFIPDAMSHKGAIGLMQLRPSTAFYIGDKIGVKIRKKDLTTPDINVKLGISYIKYLEERLSQIKDEERRLILILASYNSGLHKVKKVFKCRGFQCYIDRANLSTSKQFKRAMNDLPEETQDYLRKVMIYYCYYKRVFNST